MPCMGRQFPAKTATSFARPSRANQSRKKRGLAGQNRIALRVPTSRFGDRKPAAATAHARNRRSCETHPHAIEQPAPQRLAKLPLFDQHAPASSCSGPKRSCRRAADRVYRHQPLAPPASARQPVNRPQAVHNPSQHPTPPPRQRRARKSAPGCTSGDPPHVRPSPRCRTRGS